MTDFIVLQNLCQLYQVCLLLEDPATAVMHSVSMVILTTTYTQLIGFLQALKRRFRVVNGEMDRWGQPITSVDEICIFNVAQFFNLNKLKTLAASHDGLCEAAHCLNNVFTVQTLCFVAVVFLATLFAVFGNFRLLLGKDVDGRNSVGKQILENSAISLFMVVFTVKILYECSSTCEEVSFKSFLFIN